MKYEFNKIFEDEHKEYLVLRAVYDLSNPAKFIGVSREKVARSINFTVSEVEEILNKLLYVDKLINQPTFDSGFMSNAATKQKIREYQSLEIREILEEFTDIFNSLLNINSLDNMSLLKRFMTFIGNKPVILEFIQTHEVRQFEIVREIENCVQLCRTYDEFCNDKSEEISFAYQLLKYGVENFNAYYQFTTQIPAYGGRNEGVLKFNQTVVRSFCNHISRHLTSMLNRFGTDEQQHPCTHIGIQNNSTTTNISDVNGVINLGTISGNVTNSINQLKESNTPNSDQLADLLSQLKSCIESEHELNSEDKEEALEQVSVLAEAGQNPQDGAMKKAAKTAITMLRGIKDGVPKAVTLVKGLNHLIPEVVKLFGFFHHT